MWYNPLITWTLRSPLHGLLDGNMMLVTLKGRKSGAPIITPVSYQRDGDSLWTVSYRQRKWWRNLRGGADVTLKMKGQDITVHAEVVESADLVADALDAYLRRTPQIAKHLGVKVGAAGEPDRDDVARAADSRVMIRFRL